jgi:hypothetical protein
MSMASCSGAAASVFVNTTTLSDSVGRYSCDVVNPGMPPECWIIWYGPSVPVIRPKP